MAEQDSAFRSDKTPAWSAGGVYRPDSEARYSTPGFGDQGSVYSDRRTTAGSTVVGSAWSPSMGQEPYSEPTELAGAPVPMELQGTHVAKAELES